MVLFMAFNLWIGQCFIFDIAVNFSFFNNNFPVTILELDLFSSVHADKLLLLWCQVNENSPI